MGMTRSKGSISMAMALKSPFAGPKAGPFARPKAKYPFAEDSWALTLPKLAASLSVERLLVECKVTGSTHAHLRLAGV